MTAYSTKTTCVIIRSFSAPTEQTEPSADCPMMTPNSDETLRQELVTDPDKLSSLKSHHENYTYWEMKYQDAAIFLEEGENNDKFDSHPKTQAALVAYQMVHSSWYQRLDLFASFVVLALALIEPPAVPLFQLSIFVHGAIELSALSIIFIGQCLKLRWLGCKIFFKHRRTAIKGLTLMIMVIEACVVLARQSSHYRVTRALRPLLVIDNKFCGGVRRFMRQIFQSLPLILDMLGLLMLTVSLYSLLSFFLFGSNKSDPNFSTLLESFISMFILINTSNFPDVMIPSYSKSRWSAIFFVSYLSIVLYLLMNLLLAVVYEAFTTFEKDKFRKLLLHKREATKRAFRLLAGSGENSSMTFHRFAGLMRYFRPNISPRDALLTFKYMNYSKSGRLTLNEFTKVYDSVALKWKSKKPKEAWFVVTRSPARFLGKLAVTIYDWPHFENVVLTIIIANMGMFIVRIFEEANKTHSDVDLFAFWDTLIFSALFTLEACIKCCALGYCRYFASGWNTFDFLVTFVMVLSMILDIFWPEVSFFVLARPLRVVTIFKIKKRLRDVFGTLLMLIPLMCSAGSAIILLYYFFAIVGMEIFEKIDLRDCCKNSSVGKYFTVGGTELYYLNSFSDMVASFVVLFVLTTNSNWEITMEGYAVASNSNLNRLYFMIFYLCTLVVLPIVVASILDAFRFRIQYRDLISKAEKRHMLLVEVTLNLEELSAWVPHISPSVFAEEEGLDISTGGSVSFVGIRQNTTEIVQKKIMYKGDIKTWIAKSDEHNEPN